MRNQDPKLEPVSKLDSDRLMLKIKTAPGLYADELRRYLFFPVGIRALKEYAFSFISKPSINTGLTFVSEVPFLYDKTAVTQDLKLIDKRYFNYSTANPSKQIDPNHLFRGMSGTEFKFIIEKGYVQSDRSRNILGQPEATYFSQDLQKAWIYANFNCGFRASPTFDNPNYVIKVKRKGLKYTINYQQEAEVRGGRVPNSNIVEVWEIRQMATTGGRIYLSEGPGGEIKKEGPRYAGHAMTGVRQFTENEIKSLY